MQQMAIPNQYISKMLLGVAVLMAALGASYGAVQMPWLTTGAVVGAVVLALALAAPLVLLALMLMIGPVDLSFMTGGFKSLFPELGGLDMNGIRLLGATAGFLAYSVVEPRSRNAAWSAIGKPWLAFLAVATASLAFSPDRLEGARLLLKLAYPFLTFLIVLGLADTRERLQALMRYLLISAFVLTLIVNPILVWNGGYRIEYDGSLRMGGLGLGDSPYAFYCTAILMIVFARFLIRRQPVYLLFGGTLVIWIALTQTRIAALAVIVAIGTMGLLAASLSGNRRALIGTIVTVVFAGFALTPNVLQRSLGYTPNPAELLRLLADPVALYNSINWQGRQYIWAILWGAFMASPLFGLGLGASAVVLIDTFGSRGIRVAHNEYLRLATDTGVIGLALFMIAMSVWVVAAIRLSRRKDPLCREYSFAALATIVAWLVIALTDNAIDYYNNFAQYLGFLLAGAVIADANPPSSDPAAA
jgi:O-antigen ligase